MPEITLTLTLSEEKYDELIDKFIASADAIGMDTSTPDTSSGPALMDERGVQWHPDYHVGTRTKTKDGAWKRKRGCDTAAADAYEAECMGEKTTIDVAPGVSPVPPVATPPMPVPAPVITYNDLMEACAAATEKLGSERFTAEWANICTANNVTDTEELVTNETLRATVTKAVQALS